MSTVAGWETGQGRPSPLVQKAIEALLKETLGEKREDNGGVRMRAKQKKLKYKRPVATGLSGI